MHSRTSCCQQRQWLWRFTRRFTLAAWKLCTLCSWPRSWLLTRAIVHYSWRWCVCTEAGFFFILQTYVDPSNPNHASLEAKNLIALADTNNDAKLSITEVLENMDLFLGSKMVDTGRNFHDEFWVTFFFLLFWFYLVMHILPWSLHKFIHVEILHEHCFSI